MNTTASIKLLYPSLEDFLQIAGLKKVRGVNGHVIIEFNADDVVVQEAEIKEHVSEKKDKDGKVIERKIYYYLKVLYSWKAQSSLYNYQGNTLDTQNYDKPLLGWESSMMNTYNDVVQYYNNSREAIQRELLKPLVENTLRSVNNWLNENFGYPVKKVNEFLWLCNSEKHPETAAQRQQWLRFEEAIAAVSANEFPASSTEQLKVLLEYFESIPQRYTSDEKTAGSCDTWLISTKPKSICSWIILNLLPPRLKNSSPMAMMYMTESFKNRRRRLKSSS
ncbi:MAG: hypothetical protein HC880_03940 [Bacteroidia bacterium]|nr:hypothetical protein [Bacteroidia bacterium]